MLKYLVVLLSDDAVSYCHYSTPGNSPRMIGMDDLKRGILFAMKENLNIQFVYPDRRLPDADRAVIERVDHTKIMPAVATDASEADVIVLNETDEIPFGRNEKQLYVLRLDRNRLASVVPTVKRIKASASRLIVVVTDPENFGPSDFDSYEDMLGELSDLVVAEYVEGNMLQINLLTDRIMLTSMNNCNAGDQMLTLAPDGCFYVCPAFYYQGASQSCGNPVEGVCLKNLQLYKLSHAPICRHCDAYQCRRCVWLNRCTTLEVNTPSHEQCVMAHLERDASRRLLETLRKSGVYMQGMEIPELEYTDPFEKHNEW